MINVQPGLAEKWNKTKEELFAIGEENIRKNYPSEISRQNVGDISIWFVASDHFFAPNILFDFSKHPEFNGSQGSLIGLPHRHAVLIYPIENLEVVKAINTLIPVIFGMYSEGPGSVSSGLYWYKDGKLYDLPYKLEERKLQFIPPENFLEMINSLKR